MLPTADSIVTAALGSSCQYMVIGAWRRRWKHWGTRVALGGARYVARWIGLLSEASRIMSTRGDRQPWSKSWDVVPWLRLSRNNDLLYLEEDIAYIHFIDNGLYWATSFITKPSCRIPRDYLRARRLLNCSLCGYPIVQRIIAEGQRVGFSTNWTFFGPCRWRWSWLRIVNS